MHKHFVIDTNVLLHTRYALEAFADNYAVLPMTVIEELDRFKTKTDELGRNARAVIRYIDGLREEEEAYARNEGREPLSLVDGIPNRAGGRLMVLPDAHLEPHAELRDDIPDNRILRAVIHLAAREEKAILVTKDLNLRIKASIVGIETQDWKQDKVDIDDMYAGFREMAGPGSSIDMFYSAGRLKLPGLGLMPNEFVVLTAAGNPSQSALGRAAGHDEIVPIDKNRSRAYGVSGRSVEQRMALQLLLDPNVKLVTLVGGAGTGKTLLALAAGLEALRLDEQADGKAVYNYDKLLVTRPVVPMGRDLGYLPGSKDEKLSQWMQPIFDNLAFLMQNGPRGGEHTVGKVVDRMVKDLFDNDLVELEALTYIRGRSISKQYIVVDEAQNLTPHEVKTIVSRAGDGAKIVLTGDPQQIDNPYLDASSNGLTYTVERLKRQAIFGHVTLKKSERSDLAALAASEL